MLDALILAVDFGMVVLIWLVQLIVYPAFREIDPRRFPAWHRSYQRRISIVVVPLMLGQLALHSADLWWDPGVWAIVSALAIAGAWGVTFARSVPCHRALGRVGKDLAVIESLVQTNWWRTALWSLAFASSFVATIAT